ncbi:MAG TPA: dihydrodipicolinate reductase [bacterium]|nr:dihydrodipicolinate reductase [bacterium]
MRVIHYGLGPIGVGIARVVLDHGWTIAAAIDIDPQKAGRDLGTVLGTSRLGIEVTADAAAALRRPADLVVHATGSRLGEVLPQLEAAVAAGYDVASTCEELAYPWFHHPGAAQRLDALARTHRVSVVGLGVNPGFVMDLLPLLLTAPCREITRITVERVVDAAQRREPLRRKIGAGLTTAAFRAGVRAGRLGHVGLVESVAMIADALGWPLRRISEDIQPVPGRGTRVAGLHQVARGFRAAPGWGGRAAVRLELRMALGARRPHDTVTIQGTPALHLEIPGGIHGDVATSAIVANALPALREAAPGLWPVSRLPLLHFVGARPVSPSPVSPP